MERYEVLEELQPGALGTMLVVELKAEESTGKKYVMKQVECIEEKQANKALKEAMDLLKLRHSSICAYKELFVTWDNKVILKFLGQMVDALFYIHKQNIIHRNLKPSNILVTDEASFMLCDFSTEALMSDEMKWKIRVEEKSKSWMAPETLRFSFSEKSDIWSLGCVLLDMMTCFVLNTEEITSLLQDIRQDTSHLEEVLTLMQNGDNSSLPLFSILFMMLHIQPSMRPTAKALTDVPFIRECLTVAGSSLIGLKKSLSLNVIDALLEGGIGSILEFMQAYWDIEEAQAKAVQHLASFLGDKNALPCLLTFTELITSAMKTHIDSLQLQIDGCRLLLEILSQEVAAENLKKAGLIPDLLMIMRNFLHNEQICLSCCGVLWSLVVSGNLEYNIDQALLKSAVPATSAVLQEHLQNGMVAETACSALWALSLQGCLAENEYESTTALLLDALRMNPERPVLVKNACQALASLLRLSEISAFRFVMDSKGSGINLIKDAYHFHCDDPEVVENICTLMNEMVQYDDIVLDMVSQKMKELLSEIKSRFPSSMEITTLVDATLLKLQK
ncbi:serine/threonine kinase-like domain-containing protein STKLD1 isoform X20 [Struthio camelus]|uniref:serine/threonine kinase-like domain-containing protein STKLD1 isoform X20 n=1 Tax=Struthio camelus TaxID=8801 RepID=UPI003604129E